MLIDYYGVLGVDPAADVAQIRAAYRRKAKECHPDTGGSHEGILAVLEAWAVLSDPQRRADYDRVRAGAGDAEQTARSEADRRRAREQARDYPSSWPEFRRWMNVVGEDVTNASYGTYRATDLPPFLQIPWPTAGASVSGRAFIVGGSIVAYLVCYYGLGYYDFVGKVSGGVQQAVAQSWIAGLRQLLVALLAGILPFVAGAWSGAWVHRALGETVKARRPRQEEIGCPRCAGRLRVPVLAKELEVKCGHCGVVFTRGPQSERSEPTLESQLAALRTQRRVLLALLAVCLLAGVATAYVMREAVVKLSDLAAKGGYAVGYRDGSEGTPFSDQDIFVRMRAMAGASDQKPQRLGVPAHAP